MAEVPKRVIERSEVRLEPIGQTALRSAISLDAALGFMASSIIGAVEIQFDVALNGRRRQLKSVSLGEIARAHDGPVMSSNSRRGQKWPEIGLSRSSCSRIGLLHGRALRANVPRSAYLSSSAVSEGRNFSQVGERSRPRASYHAMSTQERPQALVR